MHYFDKSNIYALRQTPNFYLKLTFFLTYRSGSKTGVRNADSNRSHRKAKASPLHQRKISLHHPRRHPQPIASHRSSLVLSPMAPWILRRLSGVQLQFHRSTISWTQTVVCRGRPIRWLTAKRPLTHIKITPQVRTMETWTILDPCSCQLWPPTRCQILCQILQILIPIRWVRTVLWDPSLCLGQITGTV